MNRLKHLVKYSMKLLNEADEYVDLSNSATDSICKDIYYTLATGHLDMYSKVKVAIVNMVNKIKTETNDSSAEIIWDFLKETEDEFYSKIKNKL